MPETRSKAPGQGQDSKTGPTDPLHETTPSPGSANDQRFLRLPKEIALDQQRYESLAQAAEPTGISRKTLRRRIASGQLPVLSSGRRILRAHLEGLDAMLRPFWLG